jgi:hypothetical protein
VQRHSIGKFETAGTNTILVTLYGQRTLRKAKKLGMVSLTIHEAAQQFAASSTMRFPIIDKREKHVTGVDGQQSTLTLTLQLRDLHAPAPITSPALAADRPSPPPAASPAARPSMPTHASPAAAAQQTPQETPARDLSLSPRFSEQDDSAYSPTPSLPSPHPPPQQQQQQQQQSATPPASSTAAMKQLLLERGATQAEIDACREKQALQELLGGKYSRAPAPSSAPVSPSAGNSRLHFRNPLGHGIQIQVVWDR